MSHICNQLFYYDFLRRIYREYLSPQRECSTNLHKKGQYIPKVILICVHMTHFKIRFIVDTWYCLHTDYFFYCTINILVNVYTSFLVKQKIISYSILYMYVEVSRTQFSVKYTPLISVVRVITPKIAGIFNRAQWLPHL